MKTIRIIIISLFSLVLFACDNSLWNENDGDQLPEGLLHAKTDYFGLTETEIEVILEVVNESDFYELDKIVRLDVRAVRHILEYRAGPDGELGTADDIWIDSLEELLSIKWVGLRALEKLRSHIHEFGLINDCIIISEYIEGFGNNHKGIELLNCGRRTVSLWDVGICLVINEATTCSRTAIIGDLVVSSADVATFCRTKEGTFNDPMRSFADKCQLEIPNVMIFNGDDRLIIFRDIDRDGRFDPTVDTILDLFGLPHLQPKYPWWADRVLKRHRLEPFTNISASYWDDRDWFTASYKTDFSTFGESPLR